MQGRQEGRPEVLHRPVVLLPPVEGKDAAGHREQAQREETAEGSLNHPSVYLFVHLFISLSIHLILILVCFQEQKNVEESSGREVKKVSLD